MLYSGINYQDVTTETQISAFLTICRVCTSTSPAFTVSLIVCMTEGDYIDLSANPERFTGYAGPSAHRVWASIYEENCFGMSEFNLMSSQSPNAAPVNLPDSMTGALRADGSESSKNCLEKRVYYKIISGQ